MKLHRVVFLPDAAEAAVPAGTTLLAAAVEAHVAIDAPCGDRGVCGKCRVRIAPPSQNDTQPSSLTTGRPFPVEPATLQERTLIPKEDLDLGWRLACQARVAGDLTVRVPERALKPAVVPLSDVELRPAVRKVHLTLAEPSLDDAVSEFTRLLRAMGGEPSELQVDLPLLRRLPSIMSSSGYDVTAVAVGRRLVDVESGDTTSGCLGLAVDLGTTSVVALLADLVTGRVLGVESRLNGQANYGADVVSRITHAISEEGGLQRLQSAAVATINSAVAALAQRTGVDPAHIYEAVVVGNTCMNHLFLGIDPRSLALAPYQPVVAEPVITGAAELGLALNPHALVYTLPNIAGFVGSDTVAVILATAMHRTDEIRLALDLGTNGEMVLGNGHRLLACSTAAGPAFEGARISRGMRATEGAIERVWIDGAEVKLQVIGSRPPLGLCGSGLLDAVAQLRGVGLVSGSGRLATREKLDPSLPAPLAQRLVRAEGEEGFVLARRGRETIVLTQRDIRELQLAKGAIRAGVSIMLQEFGLREEDVAEILLAGAFGSYVNPASARAIGLVPPLPLDRITAVGNAAGQGALMALLSTASRAEATRIARSVEHVELSARSDFLDQFADAMALN